MTHNGNWFAVSRMVFDHYVVGAGQVMPAQDPRRGSFSKMEAWLWLVANAAYEPSMIVNKGREMTLQPGELMGAHSYLAEQWNWSVDAVRWFLKRLEMTSQILRHVSAERTKRNTNQCQVLTICNYDNYQFRKADEHQAEQQAHPKPTPSAPHESNNRDKQQQQQEADAVTVNCSAIYGPGFTLDFGAIDMTAKLVGMTVEEARMIAEILARDWAANGTKPQGPMSMVKKAIVSHRNGQHVQVGKAAALESAGDKIRRWADETEEKMRQKKGLRP